MMRMQVTWVCDGDGDGAGAAGVVAACVAGGEDCVLGETVDGVAACEA